MSKQKRFTENAVIYLPNEKSREIYLIKAGKIRITYNDIETGEEVNNILGVNDFFGLVSALGNYVRDETADAVNDTSVIIFYPEEFETLASKNLPLIRKFLQHFSHQVREIGSKVNQILSQRTLFDPSVELFKIGEYYQTNKKFEQAIYAYTRYTEYYPEGKLRDTAKKRIEQCRKKVSVGLADSDTEEGIPRNNNISQARTEIENEDDAKTEIAKKYYDAKSLLADKKYKNALKSLLEIEKDIESQNYEEFREKVIPDIGLCYLEVKEYGKAIKILTEFVKKYSSGENVKAVLFNLGRGYEGLKKTDKAIGFYKKILSMKPDNDPINIKTKKRLETLT